MTLEQELTYNLKHRDKASSIGSESSSWFNDFDSYLFREGTHYRLFDKLGAIPCKSHDKEGIKFAVWAPAARRVSVVGDFNHWNPDANPFTKRVEAGVWEVFIADLPLGQRYKYYVENHSGQRLWKSDPFANYFACNRSQDGIIWQSKHMWQDQQWMMKRGDIQKADQPMNIYELHLGSWRRKNNGQASDFLEYREIAEMLPAYLQEMNYTHVEFMPIMEHPFYGSWGYQITGFFAPTHRYGDPDGLRYLIDALHLAGIGVILDWVPSHFPGDDFGLHSFDGTCLFEYSDPRKGFHRDWHSYIFDYGKPEVRSFLISNALYWLEKYHIDGLRVDAVASMLYLDYSRLEGEWVPNQYGGRENLEAIEFLKQFNEAVHRYFPGVLTIAEESTAWPKVSHPITAGGLGFDMKWDMGWMHDTLKYFARDPIHRKYHHNEMTFRAIYASSENFVLSISHDEVVYGKYSLINKMPGDLWQKFANLRSLFAYKIATPGKKLSFMSNEFGQWNEWNHDASLDWHLAGEGYHAGLMKCVKDLNHFYSSLPAFFETDFASSGFQWVDCSDQEKSVLSFLRKSYDGRQVILCIFNLTPRVLSNYRVGVPSDGFWQEILNTDSNNYGGAGHGNFGGREATPVPFHGFWNSLSLTLPPLSALYFLRETRS